MTLDSGRLLAAARVAAREAGRIQREGLGTRLEVDHKGTYDLVTDIDRLCEAAVLPALREALPGAAILAEEGAPGTDPDEAEAVWIVDPLDGTTNYARGYPFFCVSIALRHAGQVAFGVVYEPLRDEMFEARRGGGAVLNGRPVRVTDTLDLDQALLATGFPYDRLEHPETNLDRFCAMTMRTRGVRRDGSAALDLCYVAAGRLDGYWEQRTKPWDVSAGALIVSEAGGRVTDLAGRPYDWSGRETLASNGALHEALVRSLAEPWTGGPCYG